MVILIAILLFCDESMFAQSSKLLYARFLGGRVDADAQAVVVDAAGNTYVAGNTFSGHLEKSVLPDFPISFRSFFKERRAGRQGFLVKLDATGNTLFSTLLPTNNATGIALDHSGNICLTGEYLWASHATPGAFQETSHGGGDGHDSGEAFVMKVDRTGAKLLWATHLGGGRYERAGGIAVDSKDRVYVTGSTTSPDFPVTGNALQKTLITQTSEEGDAFVTVFEGDGKRLVYSTLLGNSANASAEAIGLDHSGKVYVTGNARTAFPTTKGAWRSDGEGAFVAKLDIEHGKLLYATYLGSGQTRALAAIVDDGGSVYVTGYADPATFPTTADAYQSAPKGKDVTAFVVELNPEANQAVFSTLLGGATTDWGMAIGLDKEKRVYVAGRTSSNNFPATAGALQNRRSSDAEDVFLSVLDATGRRLDFSTLIGGLRSEFPHALAVTETGQGVVVGHTNSEWFMLPAVRTHRGELGKAFILKFTIARIQPDVKWSR